MKDATYTVGQQLWFVRRDDAEPAPVTVTAVGRRWLTLERDEWRADRSTLAVQFRGRDYYGQCYASREAYDESRRAAESERVASVAWDEFRKRITYIRPPHMTADRIREAIVLLTPPADRDGGEKGVGDGQA